jgi:hypothetical protein
MGEFPTELILASCVFHGFLTSSCASAFLVRYLELLSEQFGRRHRTVANRVQFFARDRRYHGGVHAYRRRIQNPR